MNRSPTPTRELSPPVEEQRPGPPVPGWRRTPVIAAILGVLVVIALVAVFVVAQRDDGDDVSTNTTTSSAPATSESTAPSSETTTPTSEGTTTVVPPPAVDTSNAVYPFVGGPVFDDPVEAATGFARSYAGFTDPIVGPFMQGDSRSGEVEIRPVADGPVTTVFVRQLGPDDSWWVLGTATANIATDRPGPGELISSPVSLAGNALAFEGNVQVQVRQDGTLQPLGTGFVTGGGDVMRPFQGQLEFSAPSQPYGAILFLTHSAADGRVWEAAIFRVRFP